MYTGTGYLSKYMMDCGNSVTHFGNVEVRQARPKARMIYKLVD
jgi:hypothetical protein